ncbi:hypothetical protein AJ88_26220 [Mesorhizobium amorphae CCBAU 01583]|nr:hypothetical protein AJ88_26220 [Mesorhizobium amorphae CCBAU 01583]
MKRPVIVDQRKADLARIDGEIERLGRQIAEKEAALEADVQKHLSEMSHTLQSRLGEQIRVLRGHVDQKQKERFDVELGDLAEPKRQPAAAPAKVHQEWDLEPVQVPEYPSLARTEENQKTFTETYERFVAGFAYHKQLYLKNAGCHPDDRAYLDALAIVAAQSEAGQAWNGLRCAAIEKRLAEIESRATLSYKGVWDREAAYRHGDVLPTRAVAGIASLTTLRGFSREKDSAGN